MSGLDRMAGEREIASPDDMEELGRHVGRELSAGDVVVLTGGLGAGKTTLTRGIAEALNVRGPVQSPTFVIARTHPPLDDGPPLVHVDAYRLGSAAELDDLGLDLERSVTIVEWGRDMVDAVTDQWWEIEIDRGWGGTGVDTACGTSGPHAEEMEDRAPRRVTIRRRAR
jgi:tRNA threonylcarbamoyl adenosine modification protein YjeE